MEHEDKPLVEPMITFSNPSYREWLLSKAREAPTEAERDRLLKLAGEPAARSDR